MNKTQQVGYASRTSFELGVAFGKWYAMHILHALFVMNPFKALSATGTELSESNSQTGLRYKVFSCLSCFSWTEANINA
jgi:hypothetical protein